MKKFLPYIERYVHFVALGLGVLFVLYMVYAYVITPPVTATVGSRPVDLGNVDKVILEGPASQLQSDINRGTSAETIQKIDDIKSAPPLDKFVRTISTVDAPPFHSGVIATMTTPPLVPGLPGQEPQPIVPDTGPVTGTELDQKPGQVDEFAPPASIYVALSTGRSAVTPPPPPQNPNPNAALPGANPATPAAQPAQPIQPLQPIQPIQTVPGAITANTQPSIDVNWVSLHYKIPGGQLADAFKKARIPAVRSATSFLRVELLRQEMLPDGKWGPETVVPPFTMAFLDAPVWPIPPHPVQAQQDANVDAYIQWAQSHAQAILQPGFYNVVKGDAPGLPGEPLVAVGLPQAKPFDPANPGVAPPGGWDAEKLKLIREAQRQKQLQQRQQRPAPGIRNPRGRGGPGGEGGDVAYAPRDTARPTSFYQVRSPYNRPPGDIMEEMPPEDMGGPGGMGIVTQTNNEALNRLLQTIPNVSPFDPAQLTADVDVIAYDETPTPGKTYRYRMRYYILNPILGAVNLVQRPAFAQQFALASEPSPWSDPVETQPVVNFYLAGGGGGDSIRLDIYRWQNGDVNRVSQAVSPGDRVGLVSKDGIDYSTPWTVIDVRSAGSAADRYAILQNEEGMIIRREAKLDAVNPAKRSLDAQYTAAQQVLEAAKAATRPTTPGAPVPPSPTLTR